MVKKIDLKTRQWMQVEKKVTQLAVYAISAIQPSIVNNSNMDKIGKARAERGKGWGEQDNHWSRVQAPLPPATDFGA
jgi:hypothetical protein